MGTGVLFRGQSGRGVKLTIHLNLSAKVKNERIYTATPALCLQDVCRHNITINIDKMETTKSIPLTFTANCEGCE